ncbi:hypothetical protein BBG47_27390 [Paenibacillus sp. KS1]|uniref:hypothetical protein n=1 Tax=Paenibacillus sp. KS1 TaxID=1849249 RepID=UPI0008064DBC|nr:hypothetical protein [Paenibacillus sp. KS1]OBY76388.1 hypothetical protein BBG47_27390 [Paenibacillus sp. KS1]
MKKCLVALILLAFLGSPSLGAKQSVAVEAEKPASSTRLITEQQKLFSVKISAPQKVAANEEFMIKADLKKETEEDLTMMSGTKLFVYIIKDSSGKQINSYPIKSAGMIWVFKGEAGKKTSENYKYKIKEPGVYEVSAIGEFAIEQDGSYKFHKIQTDSKKVVVEKKKELK